MKIEHKDTRILRECLARLHRMIPVPHIQKYIDQQMRAYAASVAEYCEHVELAEIKQQEDNKVLCGCLDCGKRFIKEKGKIND